LCGVGSLRLCGSESELIPELVSGITSGKQIVVREASSVRLCQHVLEPARAHLLLAQRLYEQGHEFSGAWNIAPRDEDAIAVRRLGESFIKHWGTGKLVFSSNENGPQAQPAFRLNTGKAQSQLGWKPSLPLEEALAWTVEWYKGFYADPASSWRTTEDQIQRYMRLSGT
jgi:CDP-glucose 4,6-dehydratase